MVFLRVAEARASGAPARPGAAGRGAAAAGAESELRGGGGTKRTMALDGFYKVAPPPLVNGLSSH